MSTLKNYFVKIAVCFAIIIVSAVSVNAQNNNKRFNPANHFRDISASAGIYTKMNSNGYLNEGQISSLDYGHFYYSGIGVRSGVSYVSGLDNNIDMFLVPISFAWRSPISWKRNMGERMAGALSTYCENPEQGVFPAIISTFPFRFEIDGGLTPGYICGNGSANGIMINHRFVLTADIGARLSLRIWRFNLLIAPIYHYMLTDNFKMAADSKNNYNHNKSYMSLNFGLSYIL